MKNGFTYLINLDVQGQGAIGKLLSVIDSLENRIDKLELGAKGFAGKLDEIGNRGANMFNRLRSSAGSLIAQIGAVAFTMSSINTAVDTDSMERSIRFAGAENGAKNIEFVHDTVAALKMPLDVATEGFKTLSGGMMGTGVTVAQQRDIFKSMGEASLVMGLSADESKGALLALSQMASKGTVSAEELRGQLGERLPGAFNIAARAMGVSTSQLGKMMEKGDVVASDFLPKFAKELHKTFGPGVQDALTSPRAMMNDLNNSFIKMKNEVGKGLLPVVSQLVTVALIPAATWIGQNVGTIMALVTIIGTWILLQKTAVFWQGLWRVATIASAGAQMLFTGAIGRSILASMVASGVTGGFTAAVTALNAAFWANPIMWVVGIIASLVIAIVWAWNKFEGFRGAIVGMTSWMMEFGRVIKDYVVTRLQGLGMMVDGFLNLDLNKIWEGGKQAMFGSDGDYKKYGERLSNAFDAGWNTGVKAEPIDLVSMLTPDNAVQGAFFQVDGTGGNMKGDGTGGNKSGSDAADGITKGGAKNITINIGSLGGNATINVANAQEGADQVYEMYVKSLFQVINSANQVQ